MSDKTKIGSSTKESTKEQKILLNKTDKPKSIGQQKTRLNQAFVPYIKNVDGKKIDVVIVSPGSEDRVQKRGGGKVCKLAMKGKGRAYGKNS
jgi:hypothetical protein